MQKKSEFSPQSIGCLHASNNRHVRSIFWSVVSVVSLIYDFLSSEKLSTSQMSDKQAVTNTQGQLNLRRIYPQTLEGMFLEELRSRRTLWVQTADRAIRRILNLHGNNRLNSLVSSPRSSPPRSSNDSHIRDREIGA